MKVHYQCYTMFLKPLRNVYLKEIFQSIHLRFLDTLDHLQTHPALVDDIETATPKTPTYQNHSKEVFFQIR